MNGNKGGTERRWGRPRQVGLIAVLGAVLVAVVVAAPAMGQGTINLGYPWSNRDKATPGWAPCSGFDHYFITNPGTGGFVQTWQSTESTNSIFCSSNSAQRVQYSDAWGSASSGVLWSPSTTGYYSFSYEVAITLNWSWVEVMHCVSGWSASASIELYAGVYDHTAGSWTLTNQYNTIASLSTASVSCVNGVELDTLGTSYPVWSDKLFSWSFSGNLYLYSTHQYESDLGVQDQTDTNGPYNSNGDYAFATINMGGTGSLCSPCGDYFQYISV